MSENVESVKQKPNFLGYVYGEIKQKGFIGMGAFLGGYYGLGVLYVHGYMDLITPMVRKIAIPILLYFGIGYAGIGFAMQWVDWGTTVAIRLICASIAGVLCLAIQKLFIGFLNFLNRHKPAFLKPKVNRSSKLNNAGKKFASFLPV